MSNKAWLDISDPSDPDHDNAMRELTGNIFGRHRDDDAEPPEPPKHIVAREGSNQRPGPNQREEALEYVRDLFGHPGVEFV